MRTHNILDSLFRSKRKRLIWTAKMTMEVANAARKAERLMPRLVWALKGSDDGLEALEVVEVADVRDLDKELASLERLDVVERAVAAAVVAEVSKEFIVVADMVASGRRAGGEQSESLYF